MRTRPVVVVTGASAGIGRATATAFAKHGFDVALLARGQAGLAGAAKDVESCGARSLIVVTDVARFEEVDSAAAAVEDQLGPIDIWVNNAMTTVFAPVSRTRPDDFRRAVEVTFLGQVWGTMAALSRMRERDKGTIVNVGSALAFLGIPLQAAYCSAKFACRGFFESLRAELIHEDSRVRLCTVHLPAVNTPQFDWCENAMDEQPQPVPPIYQPELAADRIVRSALQGRPTKVVGAWNKVLVAAAKAAPRLGMQYAARGGWEAQLTEPDLEAERPVNLWSPVDERCDHGSHGRFDKRSGGFLDPRFLETLPSVGAKFARAAVATAREVVAERFERRSGPAVKASPSRRPRRREGIKAR